MKLIRGEDKTMRMTTNTMIAGCVAGLLSVSLAGAAFAEDSKAVAAEKAETSSEALAAIVNGSDITRETLDNVAEMIKRSSPNDQVDQKVILESLIDTELARQEARKSGLAEREDIQEKIQDFTDKLVLNAWMQEKTGSFKIEDAELKAAYDARIADMQKHEYKARHILLKTKEDAEAVIAGLQKEDADFAAVAKEKSTGPSGPMGGDLGWFRPDAMVKPFSEAVSKMEAGSVTSEPVETQFGWHVIKLEEKRDVKLPEFDNMKPQLQRLVEQEKMKDYMKSLRETADIKILFTAEKPETETEAKPAVAEKADK